MNRRYISYALIGVVVFTLMLYAATGISQQTPPSPDAVQEAQTPRQVQVARPEQQKTSHDQADIFSATNAPSSSPVFETQPDQGKMLGFDFARDPLNAKRPMQPAEEIVKQDTADKPKVTSAQRELLQRRYDLTPKVDSTVKMSRGKPLAIGPTARLQGTTWQNLAKMTPEDIRKGGLFPYPSLPHPKHVAGGMVFPAMQIEMFPRLDRFDVQFDIPDAFIPEFPPAIFLQNRPELGDVSRGEVVSINNFHRLFKDILTPVQLDGLRLLYRPAASPAPSPGPGRCAAPPAARPPRSGRGCAARCAGCAPTGCHRGRGERRAGWPAHGAPGWCTPRCPHGRPR